MSVAIMEGKARPLGFQTSPDAKERETWVKARILSIVVFGPRSQVN